MWLTNQKKPKQSRQQATKEENEAETEEYRENGIVHYRREDMEYDVTSF